MIPRIKDNKEEQFDIPILLLAFNRPSTTAKVFNEIRNIKPKRLYIATDGPRKNNKEDRIKCVHVQNIIKRIDWSCKVKILARKKNLGGPIANSSAITWFFENEEEGIILEDDCLPNKSFFYFCRELLERYRNNEAIMSISGDNFQFGEKRGNASYYFSIYNHCWGWATWRRAWKYWNKDFNESFINFKKGNKIKNITTDRMARKYWMSIFQSIYENKINNWDYIWTFSCWYRNGITCLPNVNLVSNIGFGPSAQHTFNENDALSNIPTKIIDSPLIHPNIIKTNTSADFYTSIHVFKVNKRKNIFLEGIILLSKRILRKLRLFDITKKIYLKIQ